MQLKVQDAHLLFALVMNVLYQQEERYQTRHGRGGEGGQHLRLSRRHQRVGSPSMATFTELLRDARDAHASALPPLEATGWVCFLACREFLFFLELVTVLAEFASVSL